MKRRLLEALFICAPVLAGAYAAVVAFPAQTAADPDFWWHLAAGKWVAENRAVPREEFWSWTGRGLPWTAHEWLAELLFYALHAALGLKGLALLGAACLGAFLFSLARRLERGGLSGPPALAALAAAVLGVLPRFKARPDVFDFVLLAAAADFYGRGRYGPVAAIAALWANLHGGSLPALWLLAAVEAASLAARRSWCRAALALISAVVPAAANPFGARLLAYPFLVARNPLFRTSIAEWLSPSFNPVPANWWPFLFLGCVFFSLAVAGPGKKVLARTVGFALLGLASARNIPLFFAGAWADAAAGFGAKETARHRRPRPVFPAAVLAAALLLAAAACVPREAARAPEGCYPVGAAAVLVPGERLFNWYAWGGYLVWRGVPVFVDGRADVYARAIFPDYLAAAAGRNWREVFSRYGVEAALLPRDAPLAAVLREAPDWRPDYEDGTAVLFRRKGAAR